MKRWLGRRSALAAGLAGAVLAVPTAWSAPGAPEPPVAEIAPPAAAKDRKPDRLDRVIDAYLASVEKDAALSAEQRDNIKSLVAAQRVDPDRRGTTITDVLATTHVDFRSALEALAEENLKDGVAALEKLAGSDNPYLAAEATFFLARAHLMEERAEAAMPLLAKLTGEMADRTLYSGEAQYLLGAAQAALLKRTDAVASFEKFLKENPEASERLRVGAMRLAEELKQVSQAEGKLPDIHDRMGFSRRKLQIEDSGNTTRKEQDKIVAMLDVLIKEAEENEGCGT